VLTVAVLAASAAVGTLGARAQVPGQIPLPTTTTSTTQAPPPTPPTAPPGSTTTTTAPSPTTTAPPPPDGAPAPAPGEPAAPGAPGTPAPAPSPDASPDAGPDTTPPPGTVTLPPQYQALMDAVKRSPANGSQHLLDALQPLVDLGVSPADAIAQGFGRFPVAGAATFVDDWWYPRATGQFHLHQGTDIFAPMGTPVRSPADGVLRHSDGGLGGLSVYVTQADGTYFYMAHLSGFVPGQADGLQVKTGDIVGYVGNTGDAAGGPTHVHFEIHMDPAKNPFLRPPPPPPAPPAPATRGKRATPAPSPAPPAGPVILGNISDPVLYGRGTLPATDPKPFLDQWLSDAVANVPALIARLQAGRPQVLLAAAMLRRFDDGRGLFAAPSTPPKTQLLWASSANPSAGPLELAEAEVSAAANELDWSALARQEAARQQEQAAVDKRQRAVLAPLTPAPLRSVLGL